MQNTVVATMLLIASGSAASGATIRFIHSWDAARFELYDYQGIDHPKGQPIDNRYGAGTLEVTLNLPSMFFIRPEIEGGKFIDYTSGERPSTFLEGRLDLVEFSIRPKRADISFWSNNDDLNRQYSYYHKYSRDGDFHFYVIGTVMNTINGYDLGFLGSYWEDTEFHGNRIGMHSRLQGAVSAPDPTWTYMYHYWEDFGGDVNARWTFENLRGDITLEGFAVAPLPWSVAAYGFSMAAIVALARRRRRA